MTARRIAPWRALLFGATVATAAQLGPIAWRVQGHHGGYQANEDERFYFALFRHGAKGLLSNPNPFDREWSGAASTNLRPMTSLVSLPLRAGAPPGATWDGLRWLGSGTTAALCVELGAIVATPVVGAMAGVLILLDPGTLNDKPLLSLAGIGAESPDNPHQLYMSRSLTPSVTMPLFMLATIAAIRLTRRRSNTAMAALGIGAAGLTGHLYTWSSALAAASGTAVFPPRRKVMIGAAAGIVLMGLFVAIGGRGQHGAHLDELLMRAGAIRTHRPLLLTHAGFWAGAFAAALLLLLPWRIMPGARALAAATLGVWAMAILHTAVLGWDVESFHFGYTMGPLSVMCWCALAWHAWRRYGRMPVVMWLGVVATCASAFMGPTRALRGLNASMAEGGQRTGEVLSYLERGGITPGSAVAVPDELTPSLAASYDGITYAAPYQTFFAVPDTVLFKRAVCAAVLTGEDSASAHRRAVRARPGSIAVWHAGRPADVPLAGHKVYFEIFEAIGTRLGHAIAQAQRDMTALRAACLVRPDFALAIGGEHMRRAMAAATLLGGSVLWRGGDGRALWLRFGGRLRP